MGRVFAGVDWGSESHVVCLVDEAGEFVEERSFAHQKASLDALCEWLRERASPSDVLVGIELSRGAVVDVLMQSGFCVYGLNPKKTDRFRDRVFISGAKDDSKDAYAIALALRHDLHAFYELQADHPLVVELREWSRMHEELVVERVRLTNQLRAQLHRYVPHYLELGKLNMLWVLKLLEKALTPAEAKKLRLTQVKKLAGRSRRDPKDVLAILRKPALSLAPGAAKAAEAHARLLLPRLMLVIEQEKNALKKLEQLCEALEDDETESCEQSDVVILRSLPGLGQISLAALLAEAKPLLDRRDYEALRRASGAAPVRSQTGKQRGRVRMRRARNKHLARAIHHWAAGAAQHDEHWKRRYAALRSRGHTHARALRTLGDRLLKVACVMLATGETYRSV